MMDKMNLIALAKAVTNAKPDAPVAYSHGGQNFTYEQLQDTLRTELNEIGGTYALYRENKNTIFSLIEETIDDYLPRRVLEAYSQFAIVKTFAQSEKPVFVQRITAASRQRAKRFITRVGHAGVYEVFKLDGKSFEISTTAYGGAAQIGFEEFLDGRIDWSDLFSILVEGLDECVLREIAKALKGAIATVQATNKTSQTSFVEKEMDKLLAIADSYGSGKSTIYCTFEFAATMVPSTGWVSDEMRNKMWSQGYLGSYKGHPVVILPQSFEDGEHKVKVMDPQTAWIAAGDAKPVYIAFEGATAIREAENHDWSRDVHAYKKFGVATILQGNLCVYQNTAL